MRTIVILTALMLLAGVAGAQQAPAAATPGVPDGTLFVVELKSKLDTKKSKVGDPVTLEVVQDAKSPDGKVVVPKKSKLMGQVTHSDASTKESPDAKLSVLITSANVKGQTLAMTGYMVPPFKAPQPMAIDTSLISQGNQHSDSGPTTREDPTAGKGPAGGDESGLSGIKLKKDAKLGTYITADKKNIVLESGTLFQVQQATLPPAAK
jgi:hypothetical protein